MNGDFIRALVTAAYTPALKGKLITGISLSVQVLFSPVSTSNFAVFKNLTIYFLLWLGGVVVRTLDFHALFDARNILLQVGTTHVQISRMSFLYVCHGL